MPFVSQAQRGWMYANHPKMAARWEAETPKRKKLPKRRKLSSYNYSKEAIDLAAKS